MPHLEYCYQVSTIKCQITKYKVSSIKQQVTKKIIYNQGNNRLRVHLCFVKNNENKNNIFIVSNFGDVFAYNICERIWKNIYMEQSNLFAKMDINIAWFDNNPNILYVPSNNNIYYMDLRLNTLKWKEINLKITLLTEIAGWKNYHNKAHFFM
eukprot:420122_1